jgi:hypothetical protein
MMQMADPLRVVCNIERVEHYIRFAVSDQLREPRYPSLLRPSEKMQHFLVSFMQNTSNDTVCADLTTLPGCPRCMRENCWSRA